MQEATRATPQFLGAQAGSNWISKAVRHQDEQLRNDTAVPVISVVGASILSTKKDLIYVISTQATSLNGNE